ncbi:hypothetical protein Trco_002395 [Trichoderma cornu-damae]|uniref:Uncharacterized protein n=1 Tax=Trichoderma cornu-damae TaxID=654480 RepID=A0A9P8TXS5_9HYPO|nr:hypothetical protein Trco_002395 [Trichoderma cornu-damae]
MPAYASAYVEKLVRNATSLVSRGKDAEEFLKHEVSQLVAWCASSKAAGAVMMMWLLFVLAATDEDPQSRVERES